MGAYHTLDLEMNRKFTLAKHEWDSIAIERIGMSLALISNECNYHILVFLESVKVCELCFI